MAQKARHDFGDAQRVVQEVFSLRETAVSDMRITPTSVLAVALVLAIALAPKKASGEESGKCLYNDEHFHIQDFETDGPHIGHLVKMMDNHVCRTTIMGLQSRWPMIRSSTEISRRSTTPKRMVKRCITTPFRMC
jgi:hypothetical protein